MPVSKWATAIPLICDFLDQRPRTFQHPRPVGTMRLRNRRRGHPQGPFVPPWIFDQLMSNMVPPLPSFLILSFSQTPFFLLELSSRSAPSCACPSFFISCSCPLQIGR